MPRTCFLANLATANAQHREIEIGRSGSRQGYSKAVDMWSIGCVTVVLLTGGSPFRDSRTKQYSDDLARDCNLTELKRSSEWSEISARPKGFVMKLLLLDESRRLTAEQALLDAWFNNDRLKPDFEDLYKRTIRHWQPSIRKKPIIEFMNACEVKQFQCSQNVLAAERRSQGRRGQSPVEPPVSDMRCFTSSLASAICLLTSAVHTIPQTHAPATFPSTSTARSTVPHLG